MTSIFSFLCCQINLDPRGMPLPHSLYTPGTRFEITNSDWLMSRSE